MVRASTSRNSDAKLRQNYVTAKTKREKVSGGGEILLSELACRLPAFDSEKSLHFALLSERNGAFQGKKWRFSGREVPLFSSKSATSFSEFVQQIDNQVFE